MFKKNSKLTELFDSVIKKSRYKAIIWGIQNRYQLSFENQLVSICKTAKQRTVFKPLGNYFYSLFFELNI